MRHLKKAVLEVLTDGRSHDALAVAQGASFFPSRAVYPYMRRLERQRLVESECIGRRRYYRITEKGRERWLWFRKHPEYFAWRMRQKRGRLWA